MDGSLACILPTSFSFLPPCLHSSLPKHETDFPGQLVLVLLVLETCLRESFFRDSKLSVGRTVLIQPPPSSSPCGLHSILPIRGIQLNCVVNIRVFQCTRVCNLGGQNSAYGGLKYTTELTESSPLQAAESAEVKDDAF